jgi:N-acetylmuramoyl-L-alanine amidase
MRRATIAQKAKAEIFLSLHVDSHPDPTSQYGQVFYHPASKEGLALALLLQQELLRLQPDNYRRASPQDYFLLRESGMPTVLVELGFLSNPEERLLLNREAYREELANALVRGIIAYFTPPRLPEPQSRQGEVRKSPESVRGADPGRAR